MQVRIYYFLNLILLRTIEITHIIEDEIMDERNTPVSLERQFVIPKEVERKSLESEREREQTFKYSCNKIAMQQLAKQKVGVKKETSEDFSQLHLIVAADKVIGVHKRKEEIS